jgi:hypothetical protein
MTSRKDRLKKLVKVQEQLKAFHETRHAGFLATASAAQAEAQELAESFDADGSLSGLFPELYNRRITSALTRKDASLESARGEAGRVARATARTNVVERAYREVQRMDERDQAYRERLELIQRKLPEPK